MQPCPEPGCPRLTPGGPCAEHARQRERQRPNVDVRRWYRTARWRRLRAIVLVDAAYTCSSCGQVQLELEVDHVPRHCGDPALFWNRGNLSALCKRCHSAKTARGL